MSTQSEPTSAQAGSKAPSEATSVLYPWIVVAVLMLVYVSGMIDRTILSLLVKPIRADLQITDKQYSYLVGFAFVIMYTISGIPIGSLVDRWNRRGIITIGVTVWSLMTASCGLATGYWGLFASRVGVGLGEATLSPATYSLVSDIFPAKQLSRALSVFAFGVPLGTGLGLVISGPLLDSLTAVGPVDWPLIGALKPWQTIFMIVGLPGLLLAVLIMLIVREPARHKTKGATAAEALAEQSPRLGAVFAYLWEHKAVYGPIFFGMGCFLIVSYGANTWNPAYLQRVHGYTAKETGLMLGISTLIFGILGSITAGALADHWIKRGQFDGHVRTGMLFLGGMLLCSAIGPLVPIGWLSVVLVSASTFFLFNIVGTCAALVQIVTPNRMRGQVSAIYFFFINMIGQGIGPLAVASATDDIFGRDDAVGKSLALVSAVSVAVGLLLLQFGRRPIGELVRLRVSAGK